MLILDVVIRTNGNFASQEHGASGDMVNETAFEAS